MTPITIALLLSALPAALAYPKHLGFGHAAVHARGTGHRHHSGSSSGPYVSTSTTYAQSSSASSTLAASSTSTSVISSTSAPASTAIAAPKTAASSSTTSSSATATPSSYSPPTGTKRGLVYNTASLTDAFASAPIDWAYNWAASTSGLPSQFEFVPMLWGLGSHTEGWTAAASSAISSGSGYLLGFNEPDMSLADGGSDLSPADAVTGWNANMQQFAGGSTKLGSPAVTNGGAPTGLTWLGEFVQQCSGCQIDFLNIHWYCGSGDSVANAVADFKDHVGKAVTQANGKPVWITEFRYVGSGSETDFIDQVLPWLDATGGVGRYSYFMASDNLLLSGSGLSATGEAYVSA